MHPDQLTIDESVVSGLLAAQFPQWSGLPLRPVPSGGTVNALYRVGNEVLLRLPLRPGTGADDLLAEQRACHRFAGLLPVLVPEPVALGAPGDGYPSPWAAYRWIDGEIADPHRLDRLPDEAERLAADLAEVVRALRAVPTGDTVSTGRGRGAPLAASADWVAESLRLSRGLTDTAALAREWQRALAAAPPPRLTWVHTDLMPGNLLLREGRLVAVIDFGGADIGDPAVDLMPAWNLFGEPARSTFRRLVGADDDTWQRGRGWALVQAIGALHYYQGTNPAMTGNAERVLTALLEG